MVFISCLITSIDFCQKTIGNKRSHTFLTELFPGQQLLLAGGVL